MRMAATLIILVSSGARLGVLSASAQKGELYRALAGHLNGFFRILAVRGLSSGRAN
jgi:hypothetical protein